MSSLSFRMAKPEDFQAVLEINQSEIPKVSHLDLDSLTKLAGQSSCFTLCFEGDELAGFLLALREGHDYKSENYKWFSENVKEFHYVDRIAVSAHHRRKGVGRKLYEKLIEQVKKDSLPITCEVNIDPPNPASFDFHKSLGFEQIGDLWTKNNTIQVALLKLQA